MKKILYAVLAVTIVAGFAFMGCGKDDPTTAPPSGGTSTPAIAMISIPAGNFAMGSAVGDPGYTLDEDPQHTVYLDAYQISKYEITNAQYKTFIDAGGYSTEGYWTTDGWIWRTANSITMPLDWVDSTNNSWPDFPNYPVNGICWYEAYAFCKWAGGKLPTEAQWEKAARSVNATNYWPWGPVWDASKCNSTYNVSIDTFTISSPVGYFGYGQSPYGVYDMAGNLWEMVGDWYQSDYYSTSPDSNPTGPVFALTNRVIRGGSHGSVYNSCRCAERNTYAPTSRGYSVGFRLVK